MAGRSRRPEPEDASVSTPPSRISRVAVAALVLVLSIALATACGTEDLSPDTVAQAADATIEAGGARLALDGTLTGPNGKTLPLTGKGVMDAKGEKGRIDIDFSRIAAASGERISAEDAKLTSLFDRYEIYVGGPLLEKELPGGKQWIKIDVREVSRELGTDQLMQLNQNDPRKTLDYLRAAGDVEKLGTETVRGVETTRYKTTVDLREYANKLPPEKRAEAKAGLDRTNELFGGTNKITSEVWIDEKDLVRRIRTSYSFPAGGGQERVRAEETLELFDFGTPVSIDVPSSEKVEDVTELATKEARKGAAGK